VVFEKNREGAAVLNSRVFPDRLVFTKSALLLKDTSLQEK